MNIIQAHFWALFTVYHEARDQSLLGQKNVVKVILNRAKKKNWPVSDIVKSRKQFSCYNKGLNHPDLRILETVVFLNLSTVVEDGIKEWLNGDTLQGATHYFALKGMVDHKPPYWADEMEFICTVGDHQFFKEI